MNIAICDDDLKQLEEIKAAIMDYAKAYSEQNYEIECFHNPLQFLQHYEKCKGYDILLLDICMPGILGTEVAKEIRKKQDKNEIIFLTSSPDYAVEAFALKAAHYIIKPFSSEQFFEAMNRATEKFKKKETKKITLKLRNGVIRTVEQNEIMYVESYLHSKNVYLNNGECIESRQTILELSSILGVTESGQFISPYKGFIVNLKSIRGIEPDKITLKNGYQIPIVKRNFTAIKEKYFSFTFRREYD